MWEYYNGEHWKEGLLRELKEDKLCGFIGKTVIHPNQIAVVNEFYKVSKSDYEDAIRILGWDMNNPSFVSKNSTSERIDEYKTHSNWAQRIIYLSEAYGIKS